jgi:hypothetical protein
MNRDEKQRHWNADEFSLQAKKRKETKTPLALGAEPANTLPRRAFSMCLSPADKLDAVKVILVGNHDGR